MQKLITELSKLPSIGEKSASRLAYFLVNSDQELARDISRSLLEAVEAVSLCQRCYYLTEKNSDFSEVLCSICRNESRDSSLLCVVEKPVDLIAIERLGDFKGLYHVLHGLWAPLKGIGPEDIRLKELLQRLEEGKIKEVILATSSTVEGEATALYIARIVSEMGICATRLAQGIPKGGELEFADELTLLRAINARTTIL
jgi:recombination protein RecR